jgi:hypothetical protein
MVKENDWTIAVVYHDLIASEGEKYFIEYGPLYEM